MQNIIGNIFAIATLLLTLTSAHTWNEQLAVIGSNGSYTGAYGYPRGYIGRADPGFVSQSYLIPDLSTGRTRVNASDLLCSPAQRTQNQTAKYPRLTVAPGSAVAMKYLENGHVSLPQNQEGKPPSGGTVFVFGTTQPYDDETLVDVLAWTSDGSGGDKRGYLLAANNYDDGRCHQINSGTISTERQQQYPDPFPGQPGTKNELWCETDVVMPTDTSIMPVGKVFTIYWVWQWPTEPGVPVYPTGKDEYYSTCSDFEVVADIEESPISNELSQQDPNTLAVSGYLSRTALTSTPNVTFATAIPGVGSSYASATTTSSTPTTALSSSLTATSSVQPPNAMSSAVASASTLSSTVNLQVTPTTPSFTTVIFTFPSFSTATPSPSSSSTLSLTTLTITAPTTPTTLSSSTPSMTTLTITAPTSSTLSMTTLTVIAQTTLTTTPSSLASATSSIAVAVQPQVNSAGLLVDGSETPTTTTASPATPVVLTAVVTMLATLQPNGGVAFGGYPELVFSGRGGQTITMGGIGN